MSGVALTHSQPSRFTVPRIAAVGGLLAVVATVGVVAWHARSPAQPRPGPADPWAAYTHRWTRLASPPQARTGVALAWTGNELVSLGGAVPGTGRPARDGYAFDPRTGLWSHIPPAPGPGRTNGYAVWTGREVLLVGGYSQGAERPANVALDPATNTWRRIAGAPATLPAEAASVWTGDSLIVWGGDRGSGASRSGAAYVPATDRWHRIADAPIALNSATAAWTGSRMIVFSSSLDGTNRSATPAPIGASYDPRTNAWRGLPPSTLAPEASSVGWIGRRLGAWDYEGGLMWAPNSRWKTEVTIFQRRDRDVIDYVRSSSSAPFVAENIQSLNFTGVEFSCEVRLPHDQRLEAAYTGLHGAQQALQGLQSKYTFNYPTHDGLIAWNGRLPWKMTARSRLGVVDRYARDPYGLWDAAIAREFNHVAAHLVLSNISDTQYEEIPGVITPGRSVVFGLDFYLRGR